VPYHTAFLDLITKEYRLEELEVVPRIASLVWDSFSLEQRGHAPFNVHPFRRGDLFGNKVHHLEKMRDAKTTFHTQALSGGGGGGGGEGCGTTLPMPPHHGFSRNDLIVLMLQPQGTGYFLGALSLLTVEGIVTTEARVLGVEPGDGPVGGFRIDPLLREAVLSALAIVDGMAPPLGGAVGSCNPCLGDLVSGARLSPLGRGGLRGRDEVSP
jgi:hypothetical protein